jgi:hypothetical protein
MKTRRRAVETSVSAAPLALLRFAIKRDGTPVLSVTRRDGSVAWQRQSFFFPIHDLTHYAVETVLGLRQAFWGMMADGWEFADFGTPWPRGRMPNEPEALLAEVIAGWFDTTRASGEEPDGARLNAHLADVFAQHGHPSPRAVTAGEFARIRELRAELARRWHALAPGEAMELEFAVD